MGFGGGVTNPNYVNTPQSSIQPADLESPAIAQYQASQAQNAAGMGGMFGLGGSLLGGLAANAKFLPMLGLA
jgi:predicted lipid-binding transport protein (Tim44 family)